MKKSMFWTSVAILLLGAFAGGSYAVDITTNSLWPAGTYVISDNLTIKSGATLTIQNGAIVKFAASGLLWVQDGALDASGVTFTWADGINEWQGINLASPAAGNRLENCVIEHARGTTANSMVLAFADRAAPGEPRITGCTIGNGSAPIGIHVRGPSAQILNNTISGFSDCGVYVYSAAINATVTGNQFHNNAAGVHIQYHLNTNPTVTGNTYIGSTEADLRISSSSEIAKNVNWNEAPGTVYRLVDGFSVKGPGRLLISDGIIVTIETDLWIWLQAGGVLQATGVTFTWADGVNEWKGINFNNNDSRNRLENCTIEHGKGWGSAADVAMVHIYGSAGSGPTITGCTIGNGSAPRGIHLAGGTSAQILHNTISGFSDYGVYLSSTFSGLVAGNQITGNKRGIGLINTATGLYRVNRIQGNTEYGLYNGTSTSNPNINARYNWWGSSTGPLAPDNPLGTGDTITSRVDYFPWAGSVVDTDDDGMWDEWEVQQFTNLTVASKTSDFDLDGLLDKDEFMYGTDPKNRDSDGDGVEDGLEVQVGMNPSLAGDYNIDSDGDTYSNLREQISGTDPHNATSVPPVLADGDPLPSGDGDVDGRDLSGLISEFGRTNCSPCKYDLDTDGDVDLADLFLFSEDFGRTAL